jgi:hypothetical protein
VDLSALLPYFEPKYTSDFVFLETHVAEKLKKKCAAHESKGRDGDSSYRGRKQLCFFVLKTNK